MPVFLTACSHSYFITSSKKMFVKKFNKIIFKDLGFYCNSRQFNKIFSRVISSPNVKQNSQQDYIVKSPLRSLVYPDCSVDQYVWADYKKWSNKVAIVSQNQKEKLSKKLNNIICDFKGRRNI